MRNFSVKESGKLLDTLFKLLSDTKKTRVREALKSGLVLVNDKPVTRFDHPLRPGDRVAVSSVKEARSSVTPQFGVEVIFEDDAVVVINKPAGLLTIATETVATRTAFYSVNDYLCAVETESRTGHRRPAGGPVRRKQVFIVHRIDKEVSGLLIFAKNEEVKNALQLGWQDVTKRYYAVVEGAPQKESGTVKSFLRENKFLKVYSAKQAEGAKLSVTHYRTLRSGPDHSLLEIELATGRKHQIRVHLSDMGHPIVGDERYGAKTDPLKRIALHAYYLAFNHPVSGKPMVFETPVPEPFEKILTTEKGTS